MKKVLLCILDGVGIRRDKVGNAIRLANTPNLDYLWNNYPHTMLHASGSKVGLPDGEMGNSEVGHSNIGLGRVMKQSLEKINESIRNGKFFGNSELLSAINYAKKNNSKLHLIGLLSDGGIHSNINHLFSLLELCKNNNFNRVYIHIITDGRDTAIDSGIKYIKLLEDKIKELRIGVIVDLCGRYYAMDRDNNFDRVKLAYDMLTMSKGEIYHDIEEAWYDNQKKGMTDEFMMPSVINRDGKIENNDAVIVYNYRSDRLRELFASLTNKEFKCFDRDIPDNIKLVTMFPVSQDVICTNAFKEEEFENSLGVVIEKNNLSQLRIAETEKYVHVTYFFDGGKYLDLKNEKKILIPSPKVKTYDLMPEMSAYKIKDTLLKELNNNYDLIVLNFANGDMVGHTGVLDSGIKACEVLDECLGDIIKNIGDYTLIVTADHGNCELMINDDGSVNTNHTTNLVPFIIMDKGYELKESGKLADIAVTILNIMGVLVPKDMTGSNLIK